MISVLLPTRARPDLVKRSLESLQNTASKRSNYEVLVAVDHDDELSKTSLQRDIPSDLLDGLFYSTRYGYSALHCYYNFLSVKSEGGFLFLWNDDAMMETVGWDENILASGASSDIFALEPRSQHTSQNMSCFPVISRGYYELFRYFSKSVHCDSYIQDVSRAAGVARGVEVSIFHDRFDLTGNNNDETYVESRSGYRTDEYLGPEMTRNRAEDVETIRRALRNR